MPRNGRTPDDEEGFGETSRRTSALDPNGALSTWGAALGTTECAERGPAGSNEDTALDGGGEGKGIAPSDAKERAGDRADQRDETDDEVAGEAELDGRGDEHEGDGHGEEDGPPPLEGPGEEGDGGGAFKAIDADDRQRDEEGKEGKQERQAPPRQKRATAADGTDLRLMEADLRGLQGVAKEAIAEREPEHDEDRQHGELRPDEEEERRDEKRPAVEEFRQAVREPLPVGPPLALIHRDGRNVRMRHDRRRPWSQMRRTGCFPPTIRARRATEQSTGGRPCKALRLAVKNGGTATPTVCTGMEAAMPPYSYSFETTGR